MKKFKAIATIIGGTIGVGFLALPYAIQEFGTFWGIGIITLIAVITFIINIAYADVIISDKGNRQIPGYTKKYLGLIPSLFITAVIITGSFGVLLVYALVSGNTIGFIFSGVLVSDMGQ